MDSISQIQTESTRLRARVRVAAQDLRSTVSPASQGNSSPGARATVLGFAKTIPAKSAISTGIVLLAGVGLRRLQARPAASSNVPMAPERSVRRRNTNLVTLGISGIVGGMALARFMPVTKLEGDVLTQYRPQILKAVTEMTDQTVSQARSKVIEGFGLSRLTGIAILMMGMASKLK